MPSDSFSALSNFSQLQPILDYVGYDSWTEAYDAATNHVPSFRVFFREMWASLRHAGGTWNCTEKGYDIVVTPLDNVSGWNNVLFFSATFFLATVLTVVRHQVSPQILCWARRSGLRRVDVDKVPECAWRAASHTILWTLSLYVVLCGNRNSFFTQPCTVWDGVMWNPNLYKEQQPLDLQLLYVVQMAHYLHGTYATLFLEAWRSDTFALLLHHVVTLSLLTFSFIYRFMRLGVLVLFLHDISDVLLELTKLSVYFQRQHGKISKLNQRLSTVGFILFTGSWVLFRLYWYPLKVLQASTWCVFLSPGCVDGTLFLASNSLLWALQGLHIYWFSLILILLYKILTGKMSELEDIRELNDSVDDMSYSSPPVQITKRTEAKISNGELKATSRQNWTSGDFELHSKMRRRGSTNP